MISTMEGCGNIFEKRFIGISKTKVGKPPTRLQKHAPEFLKLDQMKASVAMTGPSEAIPLLTPLALSPIPFPDTHEFMFPIPKDMNAPTPTPFGVEASTFLAPFQNKCVLLNDAK
ncbi:hypothetical protein F3Y22_tig00111022pilonHSYRG00323 [Hibiscus syriacus]|uniref:Uncharacterized protein n=1 Tax=Hibiscus syriacus TaxID=106335 RepID=A0A6A2Z730_HIBSY|nr:hypothetical protein F3Y22_tig00111022pilonHSYRG00323 [Hibiscus syriacus]